MSVPIDESDRQVRLSRRTLLSRSISAGTVALVPLAATSCAVLDAPEPPRIFPGEELATLSAVIDRLIPADELSPAASECGVLDYLYRALGDWSQTDVPPLQEMLQTLESLARSETGKGFTELEPEQQDMFLMRMETGELPQATGQAAFNRLLRLTLEGMFSDPWYGGNRNYAGWDLIGYPGAVLASTQDMQKMGGRLPLLHTSAYGADHDGH